MTTAPDIQTGEAIVLEVKIVTTIETTKTSGENQNPRHATEIMVTGDPGQKRIGQGVIIGIIMRGIGNGNGNETENVMIRETEKGIHGGRVAQLLLSHAILNLANSVHAPAHQNRLQTRLNLISRLLVS